jgi:RND superfamily putative drug exporter
VPAFTLLIGRRIRWPSRLSPPAELPDGQQSLADDEEPALQR